MDFFQHRYYRFNKTLMTLIGYWPYQSIYTRVTCSVTIILIFSSTVLPQIVPFVKYREDRRIIFECLMTFLFDIICGIKGLSLPLNLQKVNRVWYGVSSEAGKSFIDLLTAAMYAAVIAYVTQPIISTIIDILLKNGTAPRKLPFPCDYYYFDAQKYYWYIVVHTYVCVCTGLILLLTSEVMIIICVQHVCGIFTALGHKFQRIGNIDMSVKSGGTPHVLETINLPWCIDRHNDAIKFANLIDATYTWNILFVTGFGMILLILIALQILIKKNDPEATVRYLGVTLSTILYFYVECNISENLTDSSTDIYVYIHKSQWYNLAPEAQKPLKLMMVLCRVPCQLTAGKCVTLSMRSFGQAMRTALSYFTFMRSTSI